MKKILFIDAAARKDSRTRALAGCLLEKLDGEVTRRSLYAEELPRLDEERLNWRNACCEAKDFKDAYFDLAKELAAADIIVVAAPYWDLSFPAVLKQYLEAVTINGITFTYSETGTPIGFCKAQKLYYVTTAGGPIVNDAFGYGYVRSLFCDMFGVKEALCLKAEGLDIWGADVEGILQDARNAAEAAVY